ncbi:ThiF family adenylyltransferase [Cytobacillus firmus]|uniref:E2/UBC family protein n=1 Tax=Cytobacillus firmus TaxID=1399 RepID=UPI0021C9EBEB|nr:E2/UBC family protein [Cytobacillus firmus]MCU1808238.1 ThiF family adenylyltransferase [Cytobacillus firmus]
MNAETGMFLDELKDILMSVKSISVQEVKSRRGSFKDAYQGLVEIERKSLVIQAVLPEKFPNEKPMIFLKDPKGIGFLPHIEKDGFVCYSHDEELLLDRSNPSGIIREAIQRAMTTLANGINKKNQEDFLTDFEVFWGRQEKAVTIDALFSPGDNFQKLIVFSDEQRKKSIVVDGLDDTTKRNLKTFYKCDVINEFKSFPAIYIPLREGVTPPPYWEFWNLKKIRKVIFENISASTKKRLNAYLKSRLIKRNDKEYFIMSFPFKGQKVLFGVLLCDFKKQKKEKRVFPFQHPLRKVQSMFDIKPISIKRHNREYLLNRTIGSNSNNLIDKKVCIVGLGSVGSRITFELARAGVSSFTLIDKDFLDVDNIYRHELGADSLYWRLKDRYADITKAEAITVEIQNRFPSVKVDYYFDDILELVDDEQESLMNSDLIIVALGSPTVELYLNEHFLKSGKFPPIIYTWLDPYGVGGHALLTNNQEAQGCLQCLFTHPYGNKLIQNKASFAAPNQNFAKSLAGCDSVFTPYGSMDALQTSIIAARMAIKVLSMEEKGNPLLSWKGDASELLAQGFLYSKRFELSNEQLDETKYLYKVPNCPVCGDGGAI